MSTKIITTVKRFQTLILTSFFSLLVSFTTSPVYAQIRNWDDLNGDGIKGDSCLVDEIPTFKCFEVVVGNLLFMTNVVVLLVLFIMFVIGSFKYLTSLGNPDKVEEAKGTFKWAIIGLIVYVSAYLILTIIDMLFLGGTGTIFNFNIGG